MIPALDLPPREHADVRPAHGQGSRAVVVAAVAAAGYALAAAGPSGSDVAAMLDDPAAWAEAVGIDGAVTQLAALGAWAALIWTAVGGALVLLSRLPGHLGRGAGRVADVVLPAVVRRSLEAVLGLSLVAGAVGGTLPASAQSPTATPTAIPIATADAGAGPLERPFDEPVPAAPAVVPRSPAAAPRPSAVTVVPGDCLWDIAEDYLGDRPSDRQVDRAWKRWYAANQTTVGPDPGLIHPGQRLVPPPDAGL